MKTNIKCSAFNGLNLIAALFLLAALPAGAAGTTYYWDCNSTTTGFGSASGTWGTDAFLTTDPNGVAAPVLGPTIGGDTLSFGFNAATNLGSGTVGVSGTQYIINLNVSAGSGPITVGASPSSGAISITNANAVWNNNSTNLFTVNSDVSVTPASGPTVAFQGTAGGGDFLLAGVWSGTNGAIVKRNAGTLTLNNANNSYAGVTTVQAGTLVAGGNVPYGNNGVFGSNTANIVVGNANSSAGDAPTLLIGGGYTVGRLIMVGSSLAGSYTATIGTTGSGTATITNGMTLSAANTIYNTILQAATGGTLDFNAGTWSNIGNHPITVGTSNNAGLVKIENQLAGNGNVTVNAGTLQVTAANGFSSASVYTSTNYGIGGTITPAGAGVTTATLDLNGNITQSRPLTLNGTATGGNAAVLVNSAVGTTATLNSGLITGVTFTSGGSNYNTADTIGFAPGGNNNAAATLGFSLTTNTLPASAISGGTWYVGNTITVSGGNSIQNAVFNVAAVSGTTPTLITNTIGGAGFTTLTGLTYAGAKGSGTTAPTTTGVTYTPVNGTLVISGVKMGNSGTAYTTAPAVIITTSTGSGFIGGTAVLNSLTLVGTQNQIGSGTDGNLTIACPVTGTGGFTKDGTGTVSLSASNSFTGGLIIKRGTLQAKTNPGQTNVLGGSGSGTVTLGDAAGGPATLALGWQTYRNPITLGANATGPLTIADSGEFAGSGNNVEGVINLNGNNLNLLKSGGTANLALLGSITNTGSMTISNLNNTGPGTITVSGPIDITGTITNIGVGTNATVIYGAIGSNVTSVVQNSATAPFTFYGYNNFGGNAVVNTGTLIVGTNALSSNATVTVAGGATVNLNFDSTLTNTVAGLVLNGSTAAAGVHNATTDPIFLNGTGNLLVTPMAPSIATTTLQLSSSAQTNVYLQPLMFTATVQTNGVTATAATSNVVFSVNGSPVATNALVSGQATYSNSTLPLGTTTIDTQYLGDSNYSPSSASLVQTIIVTSVATNVTYRVSSGTVILSWPADHLGWYAQSNSVSLVTSSAWHDLPGSQLGTSVTNTINPAQPKVFYRISSQSQP